jgi:hypothetical protein
MHKIVTSNIYPPIPVRSFDWCAFFDGEEEAGGYGYGATEADAIEDFVENHIDDQDEYEAQLAAVTREMTAE